MNMDELRNSYRPNVIWPVRIASPRRFTPEDPSQGLSEPDAEALYQENLAALRPRLPKRSYSAASLDLP